MRDARNGATEPPRSRADYPHFIAIPTRWMDNDVYGHVNNVTYYSYFDTAVNEHLIRAGGLDFVNDPVRGAGFAVDSPNAQSQSHEHGESACACGGSCSCNN